MGNKLNIKIMGIGGAGSNFVNYIAKKKPKDVELIIVDTDKENLQKSKADRTIFLNAGIENYTFRQIERITQKCDTQFQNLLKGTDMLFIISGVGNNTGSGITPVVVEIAKKLKIFVVTVVMTPFFLEGLEKLNIANWSIENIKNYTDSLITIPNERLKNITDFIDIEEKRKAFEITNMLIKEGIMNIIDMILKTGFVNIDFLDIKEVLGNSYNTIIKIGSANGSNRIETVLNQLLSPSNVFEFPLENAKKIIISITGGADIGLQEMKKIVERISSKMILEEVLILWGLMIKENYEEKIKAVILANV